MQSNRTNGDRSAVAVVSGVNDELIILTVALVPEIVRG
jgi:hypothetical protein